MAAAQLVQILQKNIAQQETNRKQSQRFRLFREGARQAIAETIENNARDYLEQRAGLGLASGIVRPDVKMNQNDEGTRAEARKEARLQNRNPANPQNSFAYVNGQTISLEQQKLQEEQKKLVEEEKAQATAEQQPGNTPTQVPKPKLSMGR